ncbi:GntR family transcriptional regulator protein [Rhizobium sp. NXC24]|nr:GntR family transcriptional regulator protein [Rhizobium sp. NXC24]
MEKIVKVPAEIKAADVIRNAIIDGTIAPGSRITEGQLSEELELSRATIRSALQQLATEGLMSLKRYAGWSVASLSSTDVWELYTVRSSMERLSALLVAKSIDPRSTSVLKKALGHLEKQCDGGSWSKIAEADFKFHKTIVELAGNQRLIAQYASIESQIRMYIRSVDSLLFEPATIVSQHEAIAGAIMSGDAIKASELAEAHNLVDGERLAKHLAAQEFEATLRSATGKATSSKQSTSL